MKGKTVLFTLPFVHPPGTSYETDLVIDAVLEEATQVINTIGKLGPKTLGRGEAVLTLKRYANEYLDPGAIQRAGARFELEKSSMSFSGLCAYGYVLAMASALQAIIAASQQDNLGVALQRIAGANKWLGFSSGVTEAIGDNDRLVPTSSKEADVSSLDAVSNYFRELGKKRSAVRYAKDEKQLAKAEIKELYKTWHGADAAFRKAMLDKYPVIEDDNNLARWCRGWKEEFKTAPL